MKIMDLTIDFPEIEGNSDRQIWYAEQLREKYIRANESRFREIDEISRTETDRRNLDYEDEYLPTFDVEFSNEEKCVLFATKAQGIIPILKAVVEW